MTTRKDPRKLAYLYPKMPVIRYKQLTERYYHDLTLEALTKAVQALGGYLVPASCVHHRRRDPDRRIFIFGRAYYAIHGDEITELEMAKYQAIMEGMHDDGTDAAAYK